MADRKVAEEFSDEEYGSSGGAGRGGRGGVGGSLVRNQHYDEAVDLEDGSSLEESIDTHGASSVNQSTGMSPSPAKGRARSGAGVGQQGLGLTSSSSGGGVGTGRQIDSPPPAALNDSLERGEYASDSEIPGYKSLPSSQPSSAAAGGKGGASAGGGGAKGGPGSAASGAAKGSAAPAASRIQQMGRDEFDDDDDEDDHDHGHDEEEDDDDAAAAAAASNARKPGGGSSGGAGGAPGLGGTGAGAGGAGAAAATPGSGAPSAAPGLTGVPPQRLAYNPAMFAQLAVPEEVRELFAYIDRYTPHAIELEARLQPFIPDFIPTVGGVDPFLKPPRPDGKGESLGLQRLDEPALQQSDPTVLDLQLRALSKKSGLEPMAVRSVEQAEKSPKEVTKWIASITELHRSRPPPAVHYTKTMPDIDTLMQEWPPAFEEMLKETALPTADMDMSLEEYARVACALLDIPVYGNIVQSLHVLFTLYNEFKSNQHFMNMNASANSGSGAGAGAAAGGAGAGSRSAALRLDISDDEEEGKTGY